MVNKPSFDTLRTRSERLVAQHAARDKMYKELRDMMLMNAGDEGYSGRMGYIKKTISPDPFNTVMGIVRLMTSTDPKFSINSGPTPDERRMADELEQAIDAMWRALNRLRRWPIHYEAVLSATLYGEVCMQVADMREVARLSGGAAPLIEQSAKEMPYFIDVVDPTTVYPQYSPYGLRSVLRRTQRSIWDIRDTWGKLAEKAGVGVGRNVNDDELVEFNDYWDPVWHCVWTSDSQGPILLEKHGLTHIPWVCVVTTGTSLFRNPEDQRFPILYPIWRGEWWKRQNLMMTQVFSVTASMMNPSWVVTMLSGNKISPDFDTPGSQIILRPGEDIRPLQKELIDPAVRQALDLAETKVTESTVPRVVFGEAPGPNTAYAAINLLSQAGRLPLVPIERQVARAIGQAFSIIFEMMTGEVTLRDGTQQLVITPEMVEIGKAGIDVQLKLDIPQDRLSLANVVTLLRNSLGPDKLPLISRKSALEMLGFLQATQETDAILSELFTGIELERMLQQEGLQGVPTNRIDNRPPPKPAEAPVMPPQFDPALGGIPPVEAAPPIRPVANVRGPVAGLEGYE